MIENTINQIDQIDPTNEEWNYNRCLIEASLDAFVTIDDEGVIKDVNIAAVNITGLSRNNLIDSDFSVYFTEPQRAKEAYEQAFTEGKVYDFELKLKNIDGSITPVLLNASVYKNSSDEVIGVFGTLRDITSTRKIEDELIHFKNNLEQIVKQRAAELITANIELAFQNEEKDKRAAELIVANKELAFQNVEKDKRASELIIANKELAFQNDEKYQRASELVIANKELVVQSEEKKIKEMQTNILKEQNVVLEMQKKQLDEASHLKSSFLSNMSHELRTPLNAIVGFTELALKTNLNARQRNYLSKIKISSHTLLGLISDILDLSKIEAGKLDLELAAFNLEEVIQNAVNQVSTKSQEKGLRLAYSIDDDVPLSLRGDSLRVGQILINLASNAVKFTEKGSVEIEVKLLEDNGTNILIQFSVKDTGIGMTKIQMKNLFQPFSQADTSTTRKYGGTGLGLSISHQLINMMHGEIWVESMPDAGSTFFFTLKIDIADKLRFKQFKNKFEKWGIKVLVVDTQTESRQTIGNMLTEMSIDVTLCGSELEALSILENANENAAFDLVIIDWKINEIDGIDTAKRIKQLFAFKKSPAILMMTPYLNQGIQEKAEYLGLHEGILYKPVTPSLLFNSIIQICFKDDSDKSGKFVERKFVIDPVPHLLNTKVLLVEDNEINREVAQEILQEAGLDVTLANNGQEAVNFVNAQHFDVVLMDIQMPVMDGYVATREIRKNPKFTNLPIIAMTANALISDQLDCYNAGMNDHIAKPIDTSQLFRTIALWVKKDIEMDTLDDIPTISTNHNETNFHTAKSHDIDFQTGLNRLGGNQNLYFKLLSKFRENHHQDIEEINIALENKDYKTATRIVHTLKGAAGNLSIQSVFQDSIALETALKIDRYDFANLFVEKLEHSLKLSFKTILSLENSFSGAKESVVNENMSFELEVQLKDLETLINDNNVDAVEYVDEICRQTNEMSINSKVMELKQMIEHYDFENAKLLLTDINQVIRNETGYEKNQ